MVKAWLCVQLSFTLWYCSLLTYSHARASFAASPFRQASMRPKDGAAASAEPATAGEVVTIARLGQSCLVETTIRRKGSESSAELSGEHSQGFAEHRARVGSDVQKRDDMAPQRTRSAASFALPYGYLTPEASLPNRALRTLTSF